MAQTSIIEQSRQYPTQAEIEAGLARAHVLRAEAFSSVLGSLARAFIPRKRDRALHLPRSLGAAHS